MPCIYLQRNYLITFLSLISISMHSLDVKIISFKRCMYRSYVRRSRQDQALLNLVLLKNRFQFLSNMNPPKLSKVYEQNSHYNVREIFNRSNKTFLTPEPK